MPGQSVSYLNGLMRNNLTILFLLVVIFTVDLWGRKPPDNLGVQMIEAFAKNNHDAMNQSDIDSIMSVVSQSVKQGRGFHYMWNLRRAVQLETKRLLAVEDYSSKDWLIQSFRPAEYNDTSVSFTECAVCNTSLKTTRCNVTRVELLVALIHTDSKAEIENDSISVDVNGHTVNSSRGTMDIFEAVIFDLSNILLKPDAALPDGELRITINKKPCLNLLLDRCRLFEYCNINSTILDRFQAYNGKKNKTHIDHVEDRQHEINSNTNERNNKENIMDGNSSDDKSKPAVSQDHTEKVAKGKRSLVSPQNNGASANSFQPTQGECKRRNFYVSFQRDMNRWDIIVPETKVNIGYCSSTCSKTNLFSNVNSTLTAHAVIMNTMKGLTPPVICSPRRMSSISILKITGPSLTVENLYNAKIESCWCT